MEEVTKLKEAAENLNTRKSTINWVRVFEKWCDENSLEKNLEMILPEQLDKVLERFYTSVCKQDGTDYEPETLSTGTKNSKGIFCEETEKITNFSKNVCFIRKLYF